jgi:hypothetical protein
LKAPAEPFNKDLVTNLQTDDRYAERFKRDDDRRNRSSSPTQGVERTNNIRRFPPKSSKVIQGEARLSRCGSGPTSGVAGGNCIPHLLPKSLNRKERAMLTNVKTLSTVMLLSAALATPAFAHATKHSRAHALTNFRGSYNQVITPSFSQGAVNQENFGFSGRDPSRVGGWDPSLNPSGS